MYIVSKVLIAANMLGMVYFLYDTFKDDYNDRRK